MTLHLVTGATGHIGNVLVRQLPERGQRLRALVRPRRQADNDRVHAAAGYGFADGAQSQALAIGCGDIVAEVRPQEVLIGAGAFQSFRQAANGVRCRHGRTPRKNGCFIVQRNRFMMYNIPSTSV
ncbi:MAG: NAD-dependent epimerase/dehydratase family protein [Anaerolineales bacterium]